MDYSKFEKDLKYIDKFINLIFKEETRFIILITYFFILYIVINIFTNSLKLNIGIFICISIISLGIVEYLIRYSGFKITSIKHIKEKQDEICVKDPTEERSIILKPENINDISDGSYGNLNTIKYENSKIKNVRIDKLKKFKSLITLEEI